MKLAANEKMKETLTNQLNNPYLLSLLLSLPFILIFPGAIDHYEIETLQRKYASKENELNFWADVNRDGIFEQVQTFTNRKGNAAVTIRNRNNNALNQWNLETTYPKKMDKRSILIDDLDKDSIPEISLITHDSGRIYLNIIKVSLKDRIWQEKIFLDSISGKNWEKDYWSFFYHEAIYPKNEQFADILFSISAGFSRTPRKVYRFSIADNSVISSQNLNSANIQQVIPNTNQPGYEITLSNSSPANDSIAERVFPNDNYSWLIVLDQNLDFKFPPAILGGKHSSTQSLKLQSPYFKGFVSLINESQGNIDKNRLVMFNNSGKPLDTLNELFAHSNNSRFFVHHQEPMLISENNLYNFSKRGRPIKTATLDYHQPLRFFGRQLYINTRGEYVLTYTIHSQELVLVESNWKSIYSLQRSVIMTNGFTFYQLEDHNGNPQFAMQNGKEIEIFQLTKPFIYLIRWPVCILIYLLMLGLVTFIRRLQRTQFKQRMEEERRVSVIKARSLKNLVNPHFTLNALDAISSLISSSSTDHAKSYITKFARLIHSLLSRSEDLFVPLGQELEFVKDYLDLQQLRFKDVFEYRIEITDDVKQNRMVPKIMIQTFAENAVRHGLRPKGKEGLLVILISMEQKYLKVIVEDNGIGREAALKQDTTHTGTGLKVIYQLIDILKYHADEQVQFHTEDLFDNEGKPSGTRVEVLLPEFEESVRED